MNRNSDASPGHRGGVGDQIQCRRVEGPEAQSDHEGAGNGNRGAEPRCSFNERAETEGYEQHLQAPVGGYSGDRFLHDFELPGLDRNVVKIDGGHHDPGNLQQPECDAVAEAHRRQDQRHPEEYDCDRCGRHRAGDGAPVRLNFQASQQSEQDKDRQQSLPASRATSGRKDRRSGSSAWTFTFSN